MVDTVANNKRIAKNALFLYMRMFLLMIVSLFTSRIVLNTLGVDDFGIYNVVGGIIVILSFLNSAMAGGTQRFLNVEMGRNDVIGLKKVFSASIHIHIIVSVLVLVIAETLGLWFLNTQMNIPIARIEAANWVYQFSVITCVMGILSVPYNAVIISHEKMAAFAYISILEGVLKLAVAFVLYIVPFDKLIFYAFLMLFVSLINRVVYGIYANQHFDECRKIAWKIDRHVMKQMFSFSGWSIFGNLGFILHTQGIGIILNMFFSVAVNAAQGIANQVNGVVNQFVSSFLTALNPQVVKTYAAGELDAMHKLVCRGCKMAFCMVLFFVVPITLEAPTILRVWLGIVPDYAVIFVRLVMCILLVNSFSYLLATAKGATGDIKSYQITLTIVGALHLPLAWLAFALGGGPEYSMYVYLVIVIVLQVIRVWYVCNSIELSIRYFFYEVIVKCLFVMILSVVLPLLLHILLVPSLLTTIIVAMVGVFCVSFFTLYVGFTFQERKAIIEPVVRKIKFNK